ncbi:hypothetical protein CTAM01_16971 [Colletotrichum tamarilloi]|uniref:Uncharacterized protein n=1 Tax=Colletotrichum tamarilloi TaxID=1209934 RepID=A0ABQ9QH05_9PEZI|nr:uncharacterized protein CTAM01_16971 [Colletotrichum tamarilloi]KAK1467997.1 hypothetical protein CTAM01_16971 [Colletotrichum tamarilloi]
MFADFKATLDREKEPGTDTSGFIEPIDAIEDSEETTSQPPSETLTQKLGRLAIRALATLVSRNIRAQIARS